MEEINLNALGCLGIVIIILGIIGFITYNNYLNYKLQSECLAKGGNMVNINKWYEAGNKSCIYK